MQAGRATKKTDEAISREVAAIMMIDDPLERALQLGSLVGRLQTGVDIVADYRRRAITDATSQGITYSQIADRLGMTKSNVARILGESIRREMPQGPDDIYHQIQAARGGPIGHFRPL